jgi:hypothetical protein
MYYVYHYTPDLHWEIHQGSGYSRIFLSGLASQKLRKEPVFAFGLDAHIEVYANLAGCLLICICGLT